MTDDNALDQKRKRLAEMKLAAEIDQQKRLILIREIQDAEDERAINDGFAFRCTLCQNVEYHAHPHIAENTTLCDRCYPSYQWNAKYIGTTIKKFVFDDFRRLRWIEIQTRDGISKIKCDTGIIYIEEPDGTTTEHPDSDDGDLEDDD